MGEGSKSVNSIIMSGCEIFGTVENSVLGSNVIIEKGAVVKNSIIMSDVTISKDVVINYSIIDEGTTIGANAIIGEDGDKKITVLARNINIKDNAVIPAGAMVDKDI